MAVQRALELGIDYFDTAPIYGAGQSERALGAVLRELHATPRIATKVALAEADLGNIRDSILRSVDGSLARLAQPRITMLHLHNRIGMTRAATSDLGVGALLSVADVLGGGGVVETFERLRTAGIVDHFGCSAYGGDMDAVAHVVSSGAFDCVQAHYSLLNSTAWSRPPDGATARDYRCIAARAAAAGMGVIALRVLEAGALAWPRDGGGAEARLAALARLVEPDSLAHAAVRFALSRPEVATVLVGFSNVAQVEDAVSAAAKGPLPGAVLSRIESWRAATH